MIELQGKYNTAKVFIDNVEQTAISQIIGLLNQPFVSGANIRIMSDVHAGAGCVIGFTADLKDMVIPNLIGVDIGCGMLVTDITDLHINIQELDKFIHASVPAGFRTIFSHVHGIGTIQKSCAMTSCTRTSASVWLSVLWVVETTSSKLTIPQRQVSHTWLFTQAHVTWVSKLLTTTRRLPSSSRPPARRTCAI